MMNGKLIERLTNRAKLSVEDIIMMVTHLDLYVKVLKHIQKHVSTHGKIKTKQNIRRIFTVNEYDLIKDLHRELNGEPNEYDFTDPFIVKG